MSFSVIELLVIFALPGFVFWVWSLVDALRRPDVDWEQAGQNKLVWILVLVLVGLVGSIIYLLVARPRLQEVERGISTDR